MAQDNSKTSCNTEAPKVESKKEDGGVIMSYGNSNNLDSNTVIALVLTQVLIPQLIKAVIYVSDQVYYWLHPVQSSNTSTLSSELSPLVEGLESQYSSTEL